MRKFLVVLDDSKECLSAMRFAAMRAKNTQGGVEILSIIPPDEFNHWIGVGNVMSHPLYSDMSETHSSILIGYQAKQLLASKIDRNWMKAQAVNVDRRENQVMLLGSADNMVNNRVNRRFARYASIPIIKHRRNHLIELLEPEHALDVMQDTIDTLRS